MKKTIIIISLWFVFSVCYIFLDLYRIDFISLRLNIWIQMTITAFVLASTGAILQSILQNPIADPWLLGVSGASNLGTVIISLLQLTPILFWRTTGALIGSIIAISFLFVVAKRSFNFNVSRFILIGIGVNSFCTSLIMFLQSFIAPNDFFTTLVRTSGYFVQRSFVELTILFAVLLLLTGYLYLRNKELNILSVGDELAASVGVPIQQIKLEVIIVCTIALAMVVSISGSIGFIGLATPHIVRLIFGEKEVLSMEILFSVSGILIISAAFLVRLLPDGTFVPIGSAMSLLGAPMFIYILTRNTRLSN